MNIGEVLRVKINGESVVVVGTSETGWVKVLRGRTGHDGLVYEEMTVLLNALESVEDNIQREFQELVLKNRLMSEYAKQMNDAGIEVIELDGPVQ